MSYFEQETARLYFRKVTLEDAKDWEEFFYENPNLRFLSITKNHDGEIPALSENWMSIQLERYEETGFGHLAAIDKATGEMIGQGGVLQKDLEGEVVHEVAYSIKPRFWRQGYATEIALNMKAYAQKHQVNDKVISIIHIDNVGSQKVAKNNGMDILKETTYREMPVYIFGAKI
jgi:[ribosomal protein S5]-alanine N-acetyltransferase